LLVSLELTKIMEPKLPGAVSVKQLFQICCISVKRSKCWKLSVFPNNRNHYILDRRHSEYDKHLIVAHLPDGTRQWRFLQPHAKHLGDLGAFLGQPRQRCVFSNWNSSFDRRTTGGYFLSNKSLHCCNSSTRFKRSIRLKFSQAYGRSHCGRISWESEEMLTAFVQSSSENVQFWKKASKNFC